MSLRRPNESKQGKKTCWVCAALKKPRKRSALWCANRKCAKWLRDMNTAKCPDCGYELYTDRGYCQDHLPPNKSKEELRNKKAKTHRVSRKGYMIDADGMRQMLDMQLCIRCPGKLKLPALPDSIYCAYHTYQRPSTRINRIMSLFAAEERKDMIPLNAPWVTDTEWVPTQAKGLPTNIVVFSWRSRKTNAIQTQHITLSQTEKETL